LNDPQPEAAKSPSSQGAEGYRVLARKYRPQRFEDLIGQEAMVRTLTNAFEAGRIAQAYMLTGVRGIGKTTTARLIARALNYTGHDKPTVDLPDFGEHCEAILESRHIDVIEMDAASKTGIDDVREIIDSVRYKPASARYKVYIIDEVHMLSKQAFNALLKTLEEPPEHVKFIFATTEIRKVPVTVLSRCQRFDLRRMDIPTLVEHFAGVCKSEGASADDEALLMISRAAEGSVRDGLSLLDQAISYGGQEVKATDVQSMLGLIDRAKIIDLFQAVMKGDAATAITELETQYEAGGDPITILTDLAAFVHWVTRLKIVPDADEAGSHTQTERERGKALAGELTMSHLTRAWQLLLKGLQEVSQSAYPLMAAEMILIRLAYAAELPSAADLVRTAREQPRQPAPQAGTAPTVSAAPAPAAPPPGDVVHMPPTMNTALAEKAESYVDETAFTSPPAPVQLSTFQQVVDFVGQRRDIKLKTELERHVRPVKVAPGQLEIALEQGAPRGLPGELGRKLEAWTGMRWIVSLSQEAGEVPLDQQRRQQRNSLFAKAREHPDVQTVLEAFPGAEIIDVGSNDEPVSASDIDIEPPLDDN
jgi:DNA polymerase-3 subunit gamma/tau